VVEEVIRDLEKLVTVMPAMRIEATQRAMQEWMDRATAMGVVAAKGQPAGPVPAATGQSTTCSGWSTLDHMVVSLEKWQGNLA
jgi:hypothetical protein